MSQDYVDDAVLKFNRHLAQILNRNTTRGQVQHLYDAYAGNLVMGGHIQQGSGHDEMSQASVIRFSNSDHSKYLFYGCYADMTKDFIDAAKKRMDKQLSGNVVSSEDYKTAKAELDAAVNEIRSWQEGISGRINNEEHFGPFARSVTMNGREYSIEQITLDQILEQLPADDVQDRQEILNSMMGPK